jgi:uncharacterized membrane protein
MASQPGITLTVMVLSFIITVPIVRDVAIQDKEENLLMLPIAGEPEIFSLLKRPYSYFRYIFPLLTLKVLIDIARICCYPYKK